MRPIFVFVGGRKMFIAIAGCILLTWGALRMDPFPFAQWGQWVVTLLIGTKIAAAYEDGVKHRASPGHWQDKKPVTGGEES